MFDERKLTAAPVLVNVRDSWNAWLTEKCCQLSLYILWRMIVSAGFPADRHKLWLRPAVLTNVSSYSVVYIRP